MAIETKSETFDFTVPKDSPVEADRGKKFEVPFSYQVVETEAEAAEICQKKEWSFVGLVNKYLKATAKSNAYQAELSKHRASTLSAEEMFESAVRALIRNGIPEEVARTQLAAMKAASA